MRIATATGFALLLSSVAPAVERPLDPHRPGVAVLTGAPERPPTDPAQLVSAMRPGAAPLPIADLFFLRSSWFAGWTPDGQVVMSADLTGRVNLWRMPAAGGFPLQLQQSDDKSFYPAATPDGRWTLYASDLGGGEIFDLYALPAEGGAPVNLTQTPGISESGPVAISPDSRLVAFPQRVATESSTNLGVIDLASHQRRQLTHEAEAGIYWSVRAFSPDGHAVYANRGNAGQTSSSIWRIDVASGAAVKIAGDAAHPYEAVGGVSPDGKMLSITSETKAGLHQAYLLNLADGSRTPIRPAAWPQEAGSFSPDGRHVLAITNADGRDEIDSYDLAARSVETLPLPQGKTSDYFGSLPAFSPDSRTLLYPHSSGNGPFDYWLYDLATKASRPLTRFGLATIDPAALPRTQIVHYKSADGTVISAVLWMPWNLKRDGSAPAVVLAHGGPSGQTFDNFDPTAAALASRGYIVIAPNVRGSTGYGRLFEAANHRDLGGRDLEDEAAAARFLVASGFADARRIGITGGSYGGYMTVMAVGRMPDVWAAGVEEYGIVNWTSMWERGSPALREYQRGLIGDPATDKAVYDRVSPATYLRDAKAPLLVLQGQNDIRVPAHEAEQIVRILKDAGKTVDAKYYPQEGHGFLKRENQIDAAERTIAWFDKYLKATPAR